jgi:Cu/Ag efflux pump CusA
MTVVLALLGAIILSVTFVPAAVALFVTGEVKEKESRWIAPNNARTTVIAIGWNIFASTPAKAKIGKYTTIMMI